MSPSPSLVGGNSSSNHAATTNSHKKKKKKKKKRDRSLSPQPKNNNNNNHDSQQQQQQKQKQQREKDDFSPSLTTTTSLQQKEEQSSLRIINSSSVTNSRKNLPVYNFKRQICDAISNHPVVIIVAETGSGKSTQIPSYLLETEFFKKNNQQYGCSICVTQPRRVAAITVANRVSYEYQQQQQQFDGNNNNSDVIGHRVRFDDNTTSNTKLIYATDGMLLREAMVDPLLEKYSILLLDEAHERSVQTDILFGVIKRAMKERQSLIRRKKLIQQKATVTTTSIPDIPPLHVVVMSATLDDQTFQNFFTNHNNNTATAATTTAKVATPPPARGGGGDDDGILSMEKLFIPGRQYPVQIVYTKENQDDYIDSAMLTALQIHDSDYHNNNNNKNNNNNNGLGDILVFLPGQEEIEDLASLLKTHLEQYDDEEAQEEERKREEGNNNSNSSNNNDSIVQPLSPSPNKKKFKHNNNSNNNSFLDQNNNIPVYNGVCIHKLYAALPSELQMLAFQPKPPGCVRKMILATNIAETSITLDGIKYVIDCGKHKVRDYSNTTGMESLVVQNISQAQAIQRAGRAGRTTSGFCFRLYTEDSYEGVLKEKTIPEILRCNLSQIILQLKTMGVTDPTKFELLTCPAKASFKYAYKLLYAVNAVNEKLELTDYGVRLSKLPLDPMFSHLLLSSTKYSCTKEILIVVSMLSSATENSNSILYFPPGSISNNIARGEGGGENNTGSSSGGGVSLAAKASAAHKRFISHEGDLPTFLNVYKAWSREAEYIPPSSLSSNSNRHKKRRKSKQRLLTHSEWCKRNFVNGRALTRAYDVLQQLQRICSRPVEKNGLGMNINLSCCKNDNDDENGNNNNNNNNGDIDMEPFLKCIAAGLFLQAASRIKQQQQKGNNINSRGRYLTKASNQAVSIHPTSTMFNRKPPPKCVIYTELITTKKTYIRGVTQIREDWLIEVAPRFFK